MPQAQGDWVLWLEPYCLGLSKQTSRLEAVQDARQLAVSLFPSFLPVASFSGTV